jgi:hypothetical protein
MTQSGLGDDEARLLDQAGLPAEPGADVAAAIANAARMRELLGSAFHAGEVADGLSLTASNVRRHRWVVRERSPPWTVLSLPELSMLRI